ncbi:WecB/TagA/CpsF family glycosyltransferase [Microvirga sp. BT350]|uniref:WecB/TagA/CpsF family glycosyltransferase n=2 Tax=Microvirga alba TaxID=2791025 RepID=A0A931BMN3_9HYPH|nr:WecB/TagA/CpsF family glycosyltransferase [Microvirga alba]
MDDVVARCRDALARRSTLLLGVLNAAKVVKLRKDPALRASLLECDLLLADGQSVVWASKLLRRRLPERVAGIDIFEQLLGLAHREGRSVYLLGARPDVLQLLEARLQERFPGLKIAGRNDGYFSDGDGARIAADIRNSGADMLFLGMGSPKKEIFLGSFKDVLDVPILHGVGGSFDVLAGVTKRAPIHWQRIGMEWAFRLLQEPGRMWRRYLTTNAGFVMLTVRELVYPSPPFGSSSGTAAGDRP